MRDRQSAARQKTDRVPRTREEALDMAFRWSPDICALELDRDRYERLLRAMGDRQDEPPSGNRSG